MDERPGPAAPLLDVARWIRTVVPTAAFEGRRARRALIDEALDERRVWRREYTWHTAQLDDGRVILELGASTEEAELKLSVLHNVGCRWVVRDPDHAVFFAYFPEGHRDTEDMNRVFPLEPPRRPRGGFTAPVPVTPLAPHAPNFGLGR